MISNIPIQYLQFTHNIIIYTHLYGSMYLYAFNNNNRNNNDNDWKL